MSLRISDEDIKPGRSSTMLRFTVHFGLDAENEFLMSTKGFLAFRNMKGELEIKPPVSWLNLYGKYIKFYGTSLSPKAIDAIKSYIEEHHGSKIVSNPDWNNSRKMQQKILKEEGWRP